MLKQRNIEPNEESILDWFDRLHAAWRSADDVDLAIENLGAQDFRIRREAEKSLRAVGFLYAEELRVATRNPDPEIASRAKEIAGELDSTDVSTTLYACYKVLSKNAHPDLTTPIYRTLPHCKELHVLDTALALLKTTIVEEDREALQSAASQPDAIIRGISIRLAQDESVAINALDDESETVQLLACETLLDLRHEAVLPALLDLLDSETAAIRGRAAEMLRAATNTHVDFAAYGSEDQRAKASKRWRDAFDAGTLKLFAEQGNTDDLSHIARGNTLLSKGYLEGVEEIDPAGQMVWSYSIRGAWSAERLANGNTLIASYSERRVIEVDADGNVVWEFNTPALNARWLPNKNILISTYSGRKVIEVRHKSQDVVWEYEAQDNVHDAIRLKNNNIVYVWKHGAREIKRNGDIVWEWLGALPKSKLYSVQRLTNGNTLLSDYGLGRVIEVAENQEIVWEYEVSRPSDAFRLPNGNTLITTSREHIEVTPTKQVIWTRLGARSGSARR